VRYRIIMLPFMDKVMVTVTHFGEELGTPPTYKDSYTMTPEDGDTDKLWSVLSWLAGEVAATEG
jgi:hypothetical protein